MVNVLRAGGSNPDKVVKTTVLMTDMDNYKVINEVYAKCQPSISLHVAVSSNFCLSLH